MVVVFVKKTVTRLPARLEEYLCPDVRSLIDAAENGNIPQSKYPLSTDKVLEGLGGGLGGGEGGSPLDASSMFANEFEVEVTKASPQYGVKFDI